MKYLIEKQNLTEYFSTLFSNNSVTNSVALINNKDIIFNQYDVFMKFKPKQLECFMLIGNLGVDFNDFFLDGKKYTYEDVKEELIEHGITDNTLSNYLNGRVVFPFDNLTDEHILGIKFNNSNIGYVGGWSNNDPSEIVILRNFTKAYQNPSSNNVIFYLNNLQDEINENDNLNTLSWNNIIIPKKIYFPKNLKKIPNYYLSKITLDKVNFDELTELEYIGKYNYGYGETVVSPDNRETLELDFSTFTKLKTIDEDSFTNLKIKSLILPPNIEYIKSMAFKNIYWDNAVITIPSSIKGINNAFYYPQGSYTIKFESSTPPIGNDGDSYPLASFGFTVFSENCYMMVPRGSKKAYLEAMGENYEANKDNAPYNERYERVIEYDPE